MSRSLFHPLAALAVLVATAPRHAEAGSQVYVALGDSVGFGETDFTSDPSNGDRGYVSLYANYLSLGNGGVVPQVVNLSVDGETSTTFFQGAAPGDGSPGQPAYSYNTNYTTPYLTQNQMLLATIAAEKAAGNTIGNITIQLGANDLFVLTQSPGFFNETVAQQTAGVYAVLQSIQAADATLLTELKSALPGANILLMGYYNPYAPFAQDPSSPLYPIAQVAGPAIVALDQLLAGEASAFGVGYVDLYTPFLGNELADTYITSGGNVHPNAQGYALIAAQMVAEPSGLLMGITATLVGLGCWRRRRRADD